MSTLFWNNLPYSQCPSDTTRSNVVCFFLTECICINYMCIIYAVCTAQSMCLYLLYNNQYYCQFDNARNQMWSPIKENQANRFSHLFHMFWTKSRFNWKINFKKANWETFESKVPRWWLEETRAELRNWRNWKLTLLLEERTAALGVTGTAA